MIESTFHTALIKRFSMVPIPPRPRFIHDALVAAYDTGEYFNSDKHTHLDRIYPCWLRQVLAQGGHK